MTFLWDFIKKNSTVDVWLRSKYASVYIYIEVRAIEIVCILNVFAVEYFFSYKRRMEIKVNSKVYISF